MSRNLHSAGINGRTLWMRLSPKLGKIAIKSFPRIVVIYIHYAAIRQRELAHRERIIDRSQKSEANKRP